MAISAGVHNSGQTIVFLSPLTIGAAVAATGTTPVIRLAGITSLVVQAVFLYGAGGTTTNAYIQTSLDGLTWIDIMNFSYTTTAGVKVSQVNSFIAPAAQAFTPSDGALTANTIIQGVLGSRLRAKYVTTGTYTGATSLALYGRAA